MVIPDKYIRKAYISLINIQLANNYLTCPIYDSIIPKDINPIPPLRIILSTQTKKQANTTKCGHDWLCTILLDIIYEQNLGFVDKVMVETIEEVISNAIDLNPIDIPIPPFFVYHTEILDSHDMSLQTQTKSINRKLVRYQHILGIPG